MKQYDITVHEFGERNPEVIVMFHPLGVWWDVFDRVIPILERRFHLVIPAVPGLDPDRPEQEFTSIEEIEERIETWLVGHGHQHVACLYGCSMGGALTIRMLARGVIVPNCAVIDAGITPYRLPKAFACLIGARDWCAVELAKHAGVRMLNAFTNTSKFTRDVLLYVKNVLSGMSSKTIWRAFYSTNNYSMPESIFHPPCPVQYWFGEAERSARKRDIAYVKRVFPDTVFVELKGQDHAEFFTLHPAEFCECLTALIRVWAQPPPA